MEEVKHTTLQESKYDDVPAVEGKGEVEEVKKKEDKGNDGEEVKVTHMFPDEKREA